MTKEPIAIVGPGRVGAPLGQNLGKAGWPIIYGARHHDREGLADIVAQSGSGARLMQPAEAVREARIIIFAVPWVGCKEALLAMAPMDGKILIDTTNPLVYENGLEFEVDVPHSAAELIQEWAPGAKVVKAFNTTNFRVMVDPSVVDGPITSPVAGDDAEAKAIVRHVVEDAGFHYMDAGPLHNAHYLEKMAAFYISFAFQKRDEVMEFYLRPRPNNRTLFPNQIFFEGQ